MRRLIRIPSKALLAIALGLAQLLAGCCPALCFVPHGEAFQKLASSRPYLEQWEKPGATNEDRLQASADCGGGRSPDSPFFSQRQIDAIRLPGESETSAYARRFNEFQRCLKGKGYQFIGKCYDNEISRESPACGAP